MMSYTLTNKVNDINRNIREALGRAKNPVVFWTGHKDSNTMLYFIRKFAPDIPVITLESGSEFDEVKDFRREMIEKWELNHKLYKYRGKHTAKNKKLQYVLRTLKPDYVFTSIRKDEHEARAEETVFSKREGHVRVHPMLEITEGELWSIIKEKNIPYCSLYDEGYRSLGEKDMTEKGSKDERSGRDAIKEEDMEQLRKIGYF